MQVQFKTVLFNSADYRFSVVRGNELTIVLENNELDLEFASEDDAVIAQRELGQILDSATSKTSKVTSALQDAAEVVTGLFGGLVGRSGAFKTKVQSTVDQAKTTAKATTEDLESRANDLLNDLLAALAQNTEVENDPDVPEPRAQARRNTSAQDAESVFGTSRASTRAGFVEVAISELSDNDLRSAINTKANELISTDRKVQALVEQLRAFHTEDEVQEAIESHKDWIFNVARHNDELTVTELFQRLLSSM